LQRLWLDHGTSIWGDAGVDCTIFVSQFDALPYALGLSIFPHETLFPQLITLYWRLISLLLIFGYTSYRFNRYYGLAATMLVLFNEHFYYSGANNCCIINSALIALLFGAVYNLWESRAQKNPFRFLLALLFISQLMSNKYQMAYNVFFLVISGTLIQGNPMEKIKGIFLNKRALFAILTASFITLLIFIKNHMATGLATFPIFAGHFNIFNWSPQMSDVFIQIAGGLTVPLFMKYMSYLFVWPGIMAAKYVIVVILFLPLIFVVSLLRSQIDKEAILELCFWLGMSILLVMGICLANHQDPRYYRYAIAVMSFASIFSIHYILTNCLRIQRN